jgi:hypothetical protein
MLGIPEPGGRRHNHNLADASEAGICDRLSMTGIAASGDTQMTVQ